jgi:hypothetical protein
MLAGETAVMVERQGILNLRDPITSGFKWQNVALHKGLSTPW